MPTYYEIDVSLMHIKPKIWRRFHLRPDATFADLHDAIQECGPWEEAHLWNFRRSGRGKPIAELKHMDIDDQVGWSDDEPVPDAARVRLDSVLKEKGDRCMYEYDMGDGWEHDVKLRRIIESDEVFQQRLIDGERNFPPEDCGGVFGYYQCLYALGEVEWGGSADDEPDDEAMDDLRDWLGDWDPEKFDLEKVKARFDRPRPSAGRTAAAKKTKKKKKSSRKRK